MLGCLVPGRPNDATGVLGTWRGSLVELFSNIRSTVLDAIAFARNLCRSRSALAAENLFLRKQLTFFVERKQAPRRTDNACDLQKRRSHMDGQTVMRAVSSGPASLRRDSTETVSGKPGAVQS